MNLKLVIGASLMHSCQLAPPPSRSVDWVWTLSSQALDAATVDLSSAALAYIHATDTEDGDVTGTAAAYGDATADFGDALVAWLEALDAHNVTTMEIGVYEVVVDFWTGVCPEETV